MFKILIPEDVAESGKEYLKERGYEPVSYTHLDVYKRQILRRSEME